MDLLGEQDHNEGNEEAEGRGDLNEAGVEAALVIGDMLGHVNRRTAVFTAEGQPLQDTNENQRDRREPAGGAIDR